MQRLLDFGHGDDRRRLARRRVNHQCQTGVIQFQLTGQCRFRHTGHADNVATIAFKTSDFSHRFKTWALGGRINAVAAVGATLASQRVNQLLTQRFGVGITEVDMSHVLQIVCEIGMFATAGVVDQLMRHTKMPRAHRHVDTAHRIHCQNRFGARLLQCPQVRAIVHLMGWQAMRMAVTRQKQDVATGEFTYLDISRSRAIRRVQCQRALDGQPLKLGQARAADNCVNRH